MPSKKRKYNARFPAGRIKKIMQTDEDVGKVAQAVPVIISRTLELFVESLLTKAMEITNAKNAKTLSPSHMKQCILSESRFDFLKDLVKNIPDINNDEQEYPALLPTSTSQQNSLETEQISIPPVRINIGDIQKENKTNENITANFYTEQSTSVPENPSTVIQYSTKSPETTPQAIVDLSGPPVFHIELKANDPRHNIKVPPLIPLLQQPPQNDIYNNYSSNNDSLCIDEDYDN